MARGRADTTHFSSSDAAEDNGGNQSFISTSRSLGSAAAHPSSADDPMALSINLAAVFPVGGGGGGEEEEEEGKGQSWSGLGLESKGVIQFEGLHAIFHVGRARDGTVPRLGRSSSKIQVRLLLDRLGLKKKYVGRLEVL